MCFFVSDGNCCRWGAAAAGRGGWDAVLTWILRPLMREALGLHRAEEGLPGQLRRGGLWVGLGWNWAFFGYRAKAERRDGEGRTKAG